MGRRKVTGLVLALVLAGAAAAVALLADERGAEHVTAAPDTRQPPEPRPATLLDSATPTASLEPDGHERVIAREASPSAPSENSSPVGLTARWTVYDHDDSAHGAEDGWFEYRVEDQPVQRAEVVAGTCRLEAPPERWLEPVRLELGGRGAVPLDSAWGALNERDPESVLELEARWVRSTILRVVDAHSRADLDDVEALITERHRGVLHPDTTADDLRICAAARSPITLPLPEILDESGSTERVWARAPGYGWASIEIARELGGEYVLALAKGGSVRVEVTGIREPLQPFFRVRDPAFERGDHAGVLFQRHLAADTAFTLESVPEGAYLATVEMGHHYRYPRTLDSLDLVVRSGRDTRVQLDVSAFHPPQLVEVRGELVVPLGWELRRMGLYLELVEEPTLDGEVQRYLPDDEMTVLNPDLASYSWTFGKLQPGTYEVRFNPLGQSFSIEVPPDGMQPALLEIPPPGHLEVTLVDEATGQLVEDAKIHWMPSREDLKTGGTLNSAGRVEPGRFLLTSPVGDVEIWCMSRTHRFRREIVTIAAGSQTLELKTTTAEGIDLRILDGETALPQRDIDVVISEVDGDGEGWLTAEDEHATEGHFVVTRPGNYRVEITRLPGGYRVPPPSEVHVPKGAFVSVGLELR